MESGNSLSGWVIVGLGSNLGNSVQTLRNVTARLKNLSSTQAKQSSLWSSSPVNCPPGSPDFVNAVVALEPLPGETPESLLAKLQNLEREFGRRPKCVLNEPRPLDLDLIAFGAEIRDAPSFKLPHPRAHQRRFVLQPLAEIAPDLVLPGQIQSVSQLLASLKSNETLRRIGPL